MREQGVSVLDKLHRQRQLLERARGMVAPLFPLNAGRLEALSDEEAMFLDAFRARFSELQDYLGQRVFRMIALLDEDESPVRPLSTRERVQLMERKGLLDRRSWHALRDLRNDFTHEYPDAATDKAGNLNLAFDSTPQLLELADRVEAYLRHALESTGA